MTRKQILKFNALPFPGEPGAGKKTLPYDPQKRFFSQGDPADAVFYIQKGTVKLSVLSVQGKEAVVAVLKLDPSSVNNVCPVTRCGA